MPRASRALDMDVLLKSKYNDDARARAGSPLFTSLSSHVGAPKHPLDDATRDGRLDRGDIFASRSTRRRHVRDAVVS